MKLIWILLFGILFSCAQIKSFWKNPKPNSEETNNKETSKEKKEYDDPIDPYKVLRD
ncbi:MAG: hypothetical protein SFU98_19880 [Leptospiraceae bacterium]|nr:hypothetical protein [Leptospiraceae bacterium]